MGNSILLNTILGALLAGAAVNDRRSGRIPNVLTLFGSVFALAFHSWSGGMEGFAFSLNGCLAGTGLLLIPYAAGGMGAGDVKLMGMVGAFLGAKGVFGAFLLTGLCGGVYVVILAARQSEPFLEFFLKHWINIKLLIATRGRAAEPDHGPHASGPRLCYGIVIAAGTLLHLGSDMAGIDFPF